MTDYSFQFRVEVVDWEAFLKEMLRLRLICFAYQHLN